MKKKNVLFCFAAMLLVFTSCASGKYFSINRIRHVEPELSALPSDAYTVLERVSGSGSVTNDKDKNGLFKGDTGLYGSLDSADAVYLNINTATGVAPTTLFDAALANAIYQMVEKADALKADAVLFVRTKTKVSDEGGKYTVAVEVTGTAVKLK